MAEVAFDRRVKIIIGQPQIDTAAYTIFQGAPYQVESIAATTQPAGKIINLSNIPPNPPRGFHFKLETTRGNNGAGTGNEKTVIELANLNPETVGVLHQPNSKVIVSLGYANTSLDTYYAGDIYDIQPTTRGDDIIYRITCKDGVQDALNTRISFNYDESISVSSIMEDLASKLPTASLGTLALESLLSTYVQGGVTFNGNLWDNLEKFCKRWGMSLYRYNGKINIQPWQLINGTPDYLLIGRNTYVMPSSSVITLDPIIQNGQKYTDNTNTKRGVQMTTFLTPIELGEFFTIPPEVDKTLAGTYKVTTIKISANMPTGVFNMTVRGEPM